VEDGDWSLWRQLSQKTLKFGDPKTFSSRLPESMLETFTVTLKDSEFFDRLTELTHNKPGTQPALSLADSNWLLSIDVPRQPLFKNQPNNVQVFWGWSLRPDREGNFVKKPMLQCSGEDIMMELLQHLYLPLVPIVSNSITIPYVMPQATAPYLTRARRDRPEVIPPHTTNMALLGQFVEITDETTFSMEYSVRGAQMAVSRLMDVKRRPAESKKNPIAKFLDLLT
jgi:oleate hydratase